MQINQEELSRRLSSSKNIVNKFSTKPKTKQDVKILPISPKRNEPAIKDNLLRTIIGSLALQGEPVKEIAKEFKVTPQQVASARVTRVPAVAIPRKNSLDNVRELALEKLLLSLGLMTQEKFENADLKTLSIVAANAARIVEKLSPKEVNNSSQLIIYAPEIRSSDRYKVIDV